MEPEEVDDNADEPDDQPKPEETVVTDPPPGVDLAKRSTDDTVPAAEPAAAPVAVPPDDERTGRTPLVALLVVIVLLLGLGAAELVYLGSDDSPDRKPVTAERPVQVSDLEVRRVVDQAATAADLILSASSKDYDGQVEQATATMTEPFAKEYRTTKADIEDQFVAAQTEVVVDISAQGVVTATDDEIVALLFLTQTTQKGERGGVTPVQYRVTVTMVNTSDGWLVSNLVAL
ncbi:hypothetical protein [Nocardioides sp.]|uniref:hypothetical protein n=1 Tax=Nocardioides sp. TaxID=35761 RepID=UPI002718E39E|nr:hypothetical protein [Nocardioides sp.]MDO9458265.1 hypothetical protein [Nocardioides sp.]